MPTKKNAWVVLSEDIENEKERVGKLRALVADELGLEKPLSESNLIRHAMSMLAAQYGLPEFPALRHGGARKRAE